MNINRDYLIIYDVKKSKILTSNNNDIFFYITDKSTQNIFVNLVINTSDNELITKYANIENVESYTLTMNIVKPDNTSKVIDAKLRSKEEAIFEFDLPKECVDTIGDYKCELLTKCTVDNNEEIVTSNEITYKDKASVLNDLDDKIIEAPQYPLVVELFEKLSEIDKYEEDRQLAEEQRQAKYNELENRIVELSNKIDELVVKLNEVKGGKE